MQYMTLYFPKSQSNMATAEIAEITSHVLFVGLYFNLKDLSASRINNTMQLIIMATRMYANSISSAVNSLLLLLISKAQVIPVTNNTISERIHPTLLPANSNTPANMVVIERKKDR